MKRVIVEKLVPVSIVEYQCESCGYQHKYNVVEYCQHCGKEICTKCLTSIVNPVSNINPVFESYHVCKDCNEAYNKDELISRIKEVQENSYEEVETMLDNYRETEIQGIPGKQEASIALINSLRGE